MTSTPYWDSAQVNVCNCGATTLKWQPVFYVRDEAINLDIRFDTEEACDQFIADYLETKSPAESFTRTFGPTERKMPETLEERLDALTTLVKLYMDKTDKYLKWHDGRAGGGFVYDHIHYDTDMGSGGVVR